MSYLYGDSTPSTLQVNFIEFLRDALEFCVQVLQADQRMVDGRGRVRTQEQATAQEIEQLEKLAAAVSRTVEGAAPREDGAAGRCAAAILRSAAELVKAEVGNVRGVLSDEVAKLEAEAARERDACVKALEALLVKHDLPETSRVHHVVLAGGARYTCRMQLTAAFGLAATVDLEVPADSLFGQVVRVERLMERLEVQAPEVGGWLHKEVKMRPQRLEKYYLTELHASPDESTMKLRSAPEGTGSGFDIALAGEPLRARLARIEDREGSSVPPPFEVSDGDTARLLELKEKLTAAAADLSRHRKTIVSAAFEGDPLGAPGAPARLVERLVATLAPVAQEIAARSLSPGELVLRRLLADDRREEIFASKADLKRKLEPLPEGRRALFEPLWKETHPGASDDASRRRPPLVPGPRTIRSTPPFGMPLPASTAPADPPGSTTPAPELIIDESSSAVHR
jgi:hypothetical protein